MRHALLITAAITIAQASSSFASGGMSCRGESETVRFEVASGITRGMGAPLFQLTGTLQGELEAIDADISNLTYEMDDVAQWWLDGDQLNLLLYVEREGEPLGSTELTIKTQSVDEGSYQGRFDLLSYDDGVLAEATGKVRCMVE